MEMNLEYWVLHICPHAAYSRMFIATCGALGVSATSSLVPLINFLLGNIPLLARVVPVPLSLVLPRLSGSLVLVVGLTPLDIFRGLGLPLLCVPCHGLLFLLAFEKLSSGFPVPVNPVLSSYCSAYAV